MTFGCASTVATTAETAGKLFLTYSAGMPSITPELIHPTRRQIAISPTVSDVPAQQPGCAAWFSAQIFSIPPRCSVSRPSCAISFARAGIFSPAGNRNVAPIVLVTSVAPLITYGETKTSASGADTRRMPAHHFFNAPHRPWRRAIHPQGAASQASPRTSPSLASALISYRRHQARAKHQT